VGCIDAAITLYLKAYALQALKKLSVAALKDGASHATEIKQTARPIKVISIDKYPQPARNRRHRLS